MKKAELLALIQSLPDDADIQVEDTERYDTCEISDIVPPDQYGNWWSLASLAYARENHIWVLRLG